MKKKPDASKRERYKIIDGRCEGPVLVAMLDRALEARATALLKARGYTDAVIVHEPAPRVLVAQADEEEEGGPHRVLVLVVPGARGPVIGLGEAPGLVGKITFPSYGPFLGRKDLVELQVETSHSNGLGGSSALVHYVVRDVTTTPELACRFGGGSSHGLEDHTSSTDVRVELVAKDPLTWRLVTQLHDNRRGLEQRPHVSTCTLAATGTCSCER